MAKARKNKEPARNLLAEADAFLKTVHDPAHKAVYHELSRVCTMYESTQQFRARLYAKDGPFAGDSNEEQFTTADNIFFIGGCKALMGVTERLELADEALWMMLDEKRIAEVGAVIMQNLPFELSEDEAQFA